MKYNELRIGNIVAEERRGNKYDFIIGGLNPITNTVTDDKNAITSIEYLDPIPLTEEWLIKMGFKKDSVSGLFHPTWRSFYGIYKRGVYFGFNGLGLSVKEVEYVHQLQNQFYCLTSEELTIKL